MYFWSCRDWFSFLQSVKIHIYYNLRFLDMTVFVMKFRKPLYENDDMIYDLIFLCNNVKI